MRASLARRRREWDDLAAVDPYWGVMTLAERKRGKWDEGAFFASGERQVEAMLEVAARFGLPAARGVALDFGCGLGRLTRALASRFRDVHGVDASRSLIEQASTFTAENCEFRVIETPDLTMFEDSSVDLVCSALVLQHQARRGMVREQIGEFIRVIRPGGVAIFQMPTHIPPLNRLQPRRRLYMALRRVGVPPSVLYTRLGLDPIRMIAMPREQALATVARAGGTTVTTIDDDLAGAFPSVTYYATHAGRGL